MPARKRTASAEELEKNRERFRRLVEETSDLIWEIDENGVNTYMSPKIRDVLGYEPEELVGRRPFDFMTQDEAQFIAGVFRSIAASQKSFSFSCLENVNLHKDGHEVVLETSAVPFFGEDGRLMGYRGIDRDVTRRRQVEDELRKDAELQDSLNRIRLRSGLVPICTSCKRILNEKGYWESIENYIAGHSDAQFSGSICNECAKRFHPSRAA